MFRVERFVPLIFGSVLVLLIVIFVARMLGALAALPATVQQSSCEVHTDIVCPVR